MSTEEALESRKFRKFTLKDRDIFLKFYDKYKPLSCEYNFSNLFSWQHPCKLFFVKYQEHLLIYDDIEQCSFMPLGETIPPKELVSLSLNLKNIGKKPDFCLITKEYINKFPEIQDDYCIEEERDYAEYIYNVNTLCDLKGKKLAKKRNLISQFKRLYPNFTVRLLDGQLKQQALELAKKMIKKEESPSATLEQEYQALEIAFEYFDELKFEGIAILIDNRVIAFSLFSKMSNSTYNIQFEKADPDFKGVSQVINNETAKYLQDKCQFSNREQDLGILGLRQAKMSYCPDKLIIPYRLIFKG